MIENMSTPIMDPHVMEGRYRKTVTAAKTLPTLSVPILNIVPHLKVRDSMETEWRHHKADSLVKLLHTEENSV